MIARAEVDTTTGLHRVVDDAGEPIEEIGAFLRAVATRGLSPLTVRAYAFDLALLYRWLSDTGRQLRALAQPDLLEYVAWQRERGAAPRSINRRLTACRLLHAYWQPSGLATTVGTSLPASYYRGPGRDRRLGIHLLHKKGELVMSVKVPRRLVTPLTADQVRDFLAGLRRYRDVAIVYLMLLCGLRSREVLQLAHSDACLIERRVRVLGKGNRERVVPLAGLAATAIEQYLTYERPRQCLDDRLFVCLQGKRRGQSMTPAGLRSIFRRQRNKKAAVSNANPHRFRHTFGTDMARRGVNMPVLQKLMGHENPETTLQYINLSLADLAEAYHQASSEIERRYADG